MLNCEIMAFIEEMVFQVFVNSSKPPQWFTKIGNAGAGTYLENGGIPSNVVGLPFGLNNGQLVKVWVGKEDPSDVDIGVYTHDGDEINLTLIHTVNMLIADGRVKSFDEHGVRIRKDKQITMKIISGTSKKGKAYIVTTGTE